MSQHELTSCVTQASIDAPQITWRNLKHHLLDICCNTVDMSQMWRSTSTITSQMFPASVHLFHQGMFPPTKVASEGSEFRTCCQLPGRRHLKRTPLLHCTFFFWFSSQRVSAVTEFLCEALFHYFCKGGIFDEDFIIVSCLVGFLLKRSLFLTLTWDHWKRTWRIGSASISENILQQGG